MRARILAPTLLLAGCQLFHMEHAPFPEHVTCWEWCAVGAFGGPEGCAANCEENPAITQDLLDCMGHADNSELGQNPIEVCRELLAEVPGDSGDPVDTGDTGDTPDTGDTGPIDRDTPPDAISPPAEFVFDAAIPADTSYGLFGFNGDLWLLGGEIGPTIATGPAGSFTHPGLALADAPAPSETGVRSFDRDASFGAAYGLVVRRDTDGDGHDADDRIVAAAADLPFAIFGADATWRRAEADRDEVDENDWDPFRVRPVEAHPTLHVEIGLCGFSDADDARLTMLPWGATSATYSPYDSPDLRQISFDITPADIPPGSAFTFPDLMGVPVAAYELWAWRDTNGNGTYDAGEPKFGNTGIDGPDGTFLRDIALVYIRETYDPLLARALAQRELRYGWNLAELNESVTAIEVNEGSRLIFSDVQQCGGR